MTDHFKDLYYLATEEERAKGLVWYKEAKAFAEGLAAKYDLSLEQVTGVIAALSPQCPWSTNCKQAAEFIRTKGNTPVTTYHANKKKAKAILKGEPPLEVLTPVRPERTSKTISFFKNILNPETSDEVTIDTIVIRAWFDNPRIDAKKGFNNGSILKRIREDIKTLANEHGLRPNQAQAIIWTVWKRITNTKPYTNEVDYEGLLAT